MTNFVLKQYEKTYSTTCADPIREEPEYRPVRS